MVGKKIYIDLPQILRYKSKNKLSSYLQLIKQMENKKKLPYSSLFLIHQKTFKILLSLNSIVNIQFSFL